MKIKVIKGKRKLKKNLFKWMLKSVALYFVFYSVFVLAGQYTKINEKREHLNCLNSELELQKAKNEKLRKISQATDEENEEYFVKTARELNLSKHNERIFVNISGN